jgi:hypothetical protein
VLPRRAGTLRAALQRRPLRPLVPAHPAGGLPPLTRDSPDWPASRAARREALQAQREALYGARASDRDVRLYLRRRELNAARARPSRRGGFPLDDSFDQPGTFLKLSPAFQRTVCECACVRAVVRWCLGPAA